MSIVQYRILMLESADIIIKENAHLGINFICLWLTNLVKIYFHFSRKKFKASKVRNEDDQIY